MDLLKAIRIDPNNKEFQQKLKEVTSKSGWSQKFVDDALVVTIEDERFRDFVRSQKEGEKRKLGKKEMVMKMGVSVDVLV
uniref:Uncharacterized protein n=1 Tax=Chenopodium quinoa TaxID=63459 RepID=A0A803N031_CHEQI